MYEGLPLAEFAEVGIIAAHVAGKDGGTASGSDASDQARLIRTCYPHQRALPQCPWDPHMLNGTHTYSTDVMKFVLAIHYLADGMLMSHFPGVGCQLNRHLCNVKRRAC